MVVTESTARVEIFQSIYTIIDSNKLASTTVLATFPEKSPTFPCYVINSADLDNEAIVLNNGKRLVNFTLEIDMYGDARDGVKKLDEMKDNVIDTLRNSTNISSLKTDKISIIDIVDISNAQVAFLNMKLNMGGLTISGGLLI